MRLERYSETMRGRRALRNDAIRARARDGNYPNPSFFDVVECAPYVQSTFRPNALVHVVRMAYIQRWLPPARLMLLAHCGMTLGVNGRSSAKLLEKEQLTSCDILCGPCLARMQKLTTATRSTCANRSGTPSVMV